MARIPSVRRRAPGGSAMNTLLADRAEIERGVSLLFNPADVVEVRIPKTPVGVIAGYFHDHSKMASAIAQADAKYQAGGIFTPCRRHES